MAMYPNFLQTPNYYVTEDSSGNLAVFNRITGAKVAVIGKLTGFDGLGLPQIVSCPAPATGQTGAKTNFINYTPPASAGVYRLMVLVNVTAWTTPATFTIVVTYKDDQGNARTETLAVARGSTGAMAAAITAVDRWYAVPLLISIDNSATAITVSTSGTFTGSPSYSLAAALEQVR